VPLLDDGGLAAFEASLEDFYRQTFAPQGIRRRLQDIQVSNFDTNVTATGQSVFSDGNAIRYNQVFVLDAEGNFTEQDLRDFLLLQPLLSSDGSLELIETLKESNEAFNTLTEVGIPVTQTSSRSVEDDDEDDSLDKIWLVIIIVLGSLCCCGCFAANLYYFDFFDRANERRRFGKKLLLQSDDEGGEIDDVDEEAAAREMFLDETAADDANFLGLSEHVVAQNVSAPSIYGLGNSRTRDKSYLGSVPQESEENGSEGDSFGGDSDSDVSSDSTSGWDDEEDDSSSGTDDSSEDTVSDDDDDEEESESGDDSGSDAEGFH
jgi:hypothetical protein